MIVWDKEYGTIYIWVERIKTHAGALYI